MGTNRLHRQTSILNRLHPRAQQGKHFGGDLTVKFVILHQQDAQIGERFIRMRSLRRDLAGGGALGKTEGDDEPLPFSVLTLRTDVAAHY